MNMLAVARLFAIAIIGCLSTSVSARSNKLEHVISCALGANHSESVSVNRGNKIANTHVYYLQRDHDSKLVFDGEESNSRGQSVSVGCVGKSEYVMILSGEFTANYVQGFAIRYNTLKKEWERIDFAEKARPQWVYINNQEMMVVIPNIGFEMDKRFIVYRFVAGRGADEESFSSDTLPNSTDYQVIRIEH